MEIKINRFFIAYFWSKFHKKVKHKTSTQSARYSQIDGEREREREKTTASLPITCTSVHVLTKLSSFWCVYECICFVATSFTNSVNIQTKHSFSFLYLFIYFLSFSLIKIKNDERDEKRSRIRCNEDDANMIITYSTFFFIFLFTINFSAYCCCFLFFCSVIRTEKGEFSIAGMCACLFLSWIIWFLHKKKSRRKIWLIKFLFLEFRFKRSYKA